jgi:acetyl-CoA carboxylase biotin carboxyl carrier protein
MSKARTTKTVAKKKPAPAKKGTSSTTAASMKTSEIRDLIDFISKTGLNEVDIETSELKLHIKREPDQKILKSSPVVTSMVPQAIPSNPVASAGVQQSVSSENKQEVSASDKNISQIKSPMIGTFYRSPNPDSPSFVSVGDKISKGQTVCIIEAMKLFNEIEAEISGTVVKVYLENSTPVEYDQVLFDVEPD